MLDHYIDIVKRHGNKISASWVKGIAIYDGSDMKTFSYKKEKFYFVDKPHPKRDEGYPLDSITVIPKYNKYLSDLTKEEMEDYKKDTGNKEIFDFIIKILKDMEEKY